jgi:hypothetical protein
MQEGDPSIIIEICASNNIEKRLFAFKTTP